MLSNSPTYKEPIDVGSGRYSVDFEEVYGALRYEYLQGNLSKWEYLDRCHYTAIERNLGDIQFESAVAFEDAHNYQWAEENK